MKRHIIFACVLVTIASCIVRQLGYFEVRPTPKIKSSRIEQPLYIKIGNRVQDHFSIKNPVLELKVNSFHASLQFALSSAFGDLFSQIKPWQQHADGFVFELQQFESSWIEQEKQHPGNTNNESPDMDLYCQINYRGSLYKNNQLISQSSGSIQKKYGEPGVQSIENLFKETVKSAITDLAEKIYTSAE